MGVRDVNESFQCRCCTECEECKDFQKVAEIKDAGLVIFRHIINNDNVDKQTEVLQSAMRPAEDVFIFQNTRNVDLPPANIIPTLETFKISCLRCRTMYERAQKLLKNVPIIGEKHVIGICDHCYQKQFPKSCYECEKIVDKFLAARYGEKYTKDALSTWLSKMKNLLRNVTGDEVKTAKAASRANSDLCIDKLSRLESRFPEKHKGKANYVLIPEMRRSDTNIPGSLLYNSKHDKRGGIKERLQAIDNSAGFLQTTGAQQKDHPDEWHIGEALKAARREQSGFGTTKPRPIFDEPETKNKFQMHDSDINEYKNVKNENFEGPQYELGKSVNFKDSMKPRKRHRLDQEFTSEAEIGTKQKQSAFEGRKVHSVLDDDSSIHPLLDKVPDKTSILKRKKGAPKEKSETSVIRDEQGLRIAGQRSTKSIIKKTLPINTRERKHPSSKTLVTTISKAVHNTLGKDLSYFFPLGDASKETSKLKGKVTSAALILETQKKMEEENLRKKTEKKMGLERKKKLAEDNEKKRVAEEKLSIAQDAKKRHAEAKDTRKRTKEDEKSNILESEENDRTLTSLKNKTKYDMGRGDLKKHKETKLEQGDKEEGKEKQENEKLAQKKIKQDEKERLKLEKDKLKKEKAEQLRMEKEEKQKDLKETEKYKVKQKKETKANEENKLTKDVKNGKQIEQTKEVKSTQNEKENAKLAREKLKQGKEDEKERLKMEKDMLKKEKEEQLRMKKEEKQRQKELKDTEINKTKQEKEAKVYEQNKLTKDVKNEMQIAEQTKDLKSTQNEKEKENEKLAQEKLKHEKEMSKKEKEEQLRMEKEEKQRQKAEQTKDLKSTQNEKEKGNEKLAQEKVKQEKEMSKKEKEEQLRMEKEEKQRQKAEQTKDLKSTQNEKEKGNEKLAQEKLKQEKEMSKKEKEEQLRMEKEEKQRQKELKETEIYKAKKEKEANTLEQNKLTKDVKNGKQIGEQIKDVKSTHNEKDNEKLAQEKPKLGKEEEKERLKMEKDMLKKEKEEQLRMEKEEKQRQKELKEAEIYKAKLEKETKAYEQNKLTKDVNNEKKIADQTDDVKSTQNEKDNEKLAQEKLKQGEEEKERLKVEKDMLKKEKEERLRIEQEEKQRQKELKETEKYKATQEKVAKADQNKSKDVKSTQYDKENLALEQIMELKKKKQEAEANRQKLLEAEQDKKDATLNTIDVKMERNVQKDPTYHKIEAHEVDSFIIKEHYKHSQDPFKKACIICLDSELELNIEHLLRERIIERKLSNVIVGEKIFKFVPALWAKKEEPVQPVYSVESIDDLMPQPTEEIIQIHPKAPPPSEKQAKSKSGKLVPDPELTKGIMRYALSDRTFIDKGWTMLPTEKVVRKMNVYRMRPAQPQFDWFEHNKKKRLMLYDSGERLAEFDDNGRGRWYYKNGHLALDYYDAEEVNAHQRFVLYSSGEPDERGRSRPIAILATFDYLGNGVVFDHSGKIRLKYNQTEGVVLDRGIGPVSHWKWHTLNDPPVLQQVMIDTQMSHKDPEILKLSVPSDKKPRPDNDEMLAIEFDNFVKEKSKKLSQTFKPFQIKMKALKINEHFSLKVLDQATVYLIYRDGTTNLQINIGMILDHKEIVDTDTAEVGEVSNSLERFPARTESIAGMQRSVAYAQRYERSRTERERRLRPTQPTASVDVMAAPASRPLRTPLRTGPASDTTCNCNVRKPSSSTVYYNSRLT